MSMLSSSCENILEGIVSRLPTVGFARELCILSLLSYPEQSKLPSFRTMTIFSEIVDSNKMALLFHRKVTHY